MRVRSLSLLFVISVLGVGLLEAAPARAEAVAQTLESFTFVGTCGDCTGTGTGTLVLTGTDPSGNFTTDEFVSFTYSSNLVGEDGFVLTANDGDVFASGALSTLPGQDQVQLSTNDGVFLSGTDGGWCLGNGCLSDEGSTHVWSAAAAVPEPASAALFAPALGFIGLMIRRRTRA